MATCRSYSVLQMGLLLLRSFLGICHTLRQSRSRCRVIKSESSTWQESRSVRCSCCSRARVRAWRCLEPFVPLQATKRGWRTRSRWRIRLQMFWTRWKRFPSHHLGRKDTVPRVSLVQLRIRRFTRQLCLMMDVKIAWWVPRERRRTLQTGLLEKCRRRWAPSSLWITSIKPVQRERRGGPALALGGFHTLSRCMM